MDNNSKLKIITWHQYTIVFMCVALTCQGQIKRDKYYHAIAGSSISVGMYTVGQNSDREMFKYAPEMAGIGAGFFKECYDGVNGKQFSYNDLLWTSVSAVITSQILKIIWKPKKNTKRDPFDNFEPVKK